MLDFIVLVLSVLAMGLLGLVIISRNPRNTTFRIFALLTVFSILWNTTNYLSNHVHHYSVQLFVNKLSLFLGFLLIVPIWLLSLYFPRSLSKFQKQKLAGAVLSVILLFSTLFTNGIVSSVTYNASQKVAEIKTGQYYIYSLIISLIFLIFLIYNFIKSYRANQITALQKQQIEFVSIGIFIAYVWSLLTAAIIPGVTQNWSISKFSAAGSLVLVGFTFYAIIKHKLFDIKLIVARAAAYTLTLASLAGFFVLITYLILNVALSNAHLSKNTEGLIYTLLAVILALTFPALRIFFNKATNKIFYKDAYETQLFLDQFNKVLVLNYELHPLLNNSLKVINENLKPTFAIFNINKSQAFPRTVISSSEHYQLTENDFLTISSSLPRSNSKVIMVDELDGKNVHLQNILRDKNVAVVAKLSPGNSASNIGYMMLGVKKSGNIYNKNDIQVIEILANELVIAIQNSLRFEEIQGFNATLQQKINEATYKLRKANHRLKLLDETKDDFISMASHQLRTPLTSIKGYISMMLEGDAGDINKTQHDMLGQTFISAQRMVYLIADMLNVSRLRTGKFAIEDSPINLAEIVEQEMDQLQETADAHDIHLTYKKPKEFPTLSLDETKIRQVIMNFADNAIYYTPKGGHVEVALSNNESTIELTVKDDGIGVPKSERHHLFTKFYRAGNARKVRPDGTGLGLFMAKKVIMASGGTLIFDSEEGKGSTFGFIFDKKILKAKDHPKATDPIKVAEPVEV